MNTVTLTRTAKDIRKKLITMHAAADHSHIGTSFSCLDILVALYFQVLEINSGDPKDPNRDRLLLSKGHGASALYTTLGFKGLIPVEWMDQYQMDASKLSGHPDRLEVPFVEISAGSLGHGLPIGLGMAYAMKLDNKTGRVFVILSDGEIQEGTVWEAANNASRLQLDNLITVIDANKLQSYERTDNIMRIDSFKAKWEAFGWAVIEVDGHDIPKLIEVLQSVPFECEKPSAVIAHTIKGKGIKDFEDQLGYHYWPPKKDKVEEYLKELDQVER